MPNFVPTLSRKRSQTIVEGQWRESPVMARKINTIAKHRAPYQLPLDVLLISGVDFELDVAQNWAQFLWLDGSERANSLKQLVKGEGLVPPTH